MCMACDSRARAPPLDSWPDWSREIPKSPGASRARVTRPQTTALGRAVGRAEATDNPTGSGSYRVGAKESLVHKGAPDCTVCYIVCWLRGTISLPSAASSSPATVTCSRMFSGFTSWCTMPCSWQWRKPSRASMHTYASGSRCTASQPKSDRLQTYKVDDAPPMTAPSLVPLGTPAHREWVWGHHHHHHHRCHQHHHHHRFCCCCCCCQPKWGQEQEGRAHSRPSPSTRTPANRSESQVPWAAAVQRIWQGAAPNITVWTVCTASDAGGACGHGESG